MLYNQKERAANDMQAVGQPHSIVETCERKEWVEKMLSGKLIEASNVKLFDIEKMSGGTLPSH